ncbi:hypothetical protein LX36DRAFT_314363 [Colletotrichum falcatum]|nr:hypothetical protein LX36DRAFT_314363 [Colletotrichum falcatum]
MAVIDGLPGIKATIGLNRSKEDCPEYDDPDPPQTTASRGAASHSISKVIESQDDTVFSVHVEVEDARRWIRNNRGLVVCIYIDGNKVGSPICKKSTLKGNVLHKDVKGVVEASTKPGKSILKPFIFTKIKQVEAGGARVTEDQEAVKHLGNIEVIIYRVVIRGRKDWMPKNVMSKTELAEKVMKGKNLSHGTGFSEGRVIPERHGRDCEYPDGDVRLARFIFRYKSKTALQIEGIIPRDPSPEPLLEPQPQNAADLSMEEILRLAQERIDQVGMVKREGGAGMKREADVEINPRKPKVYKTTADGVIDLTD